jgi:hypothetical protein
LRRQSVAYCPSRRYSSNISKKNRVLYVTSAFEPPLSDPEYIATR